VRGHLPFLLDLPARYADNEHMSLQVGAHTCCLIAEADPFIASLLVRFAESSGLECARARTADDVLELTRQIKPAVIIIDAELPGDISGWEIMRALKLDEVTCHIAQISCSWLNEPEVRGLVGTIAGHLQKPDFTYNDFEKALRAAGVRPADQEAGQPSPFQSGTATEPLIDPQAKG
ncbi:MAG TPA: response regulator, partial [Anaerolineae bacterium]|nr:response regulator [Anaerolineae bacterium]